MASSSSAHVYLEILEETANEGKEPYPMRHRKKTGLPMGLHEQGLLAHSR